MSNPPLSLVTPVSITHEASSVGSLGESLQYSISFLSLFLLIEQHPFGCNVKYQTEITITCTKSLYIRFVVFLLYSLPCEKKYLSITLPVARFKTHSPIFALLRANIAHSQTLTSTCRINLFAIVLWLTCLAP